MRPLVVVAAAIVIALSGSPGIAEQADVYTQGIADWRALQAWFNSQTGDRRAGADFWAEHRSDSGPTSCTEAALKRPGDQTAFIAGCLEAKRRLDLIDERRNDDPQYRAGFAFEAKQLPLNAGAAPESPLANSNYVQIGPGFDCAKATSPLFRLICSNSQLARTDLHFYQAYYALWQQLDPDGRLDLSADYDEFLNRVRGGCGIPAQGSAITGSPSCVAAQYNSKRSEWVSRLTGPALEEANRAPEQCLALQATLQRLGYFPISERIDGLYGPATRAATVAWQQSNNRPATGFIGNADAAALLQASASLPQASSIQAVPPVGTPPPAAPTVVLGSEVQLKERGGVYRVPVRVNDAITLDFTIDSGASDVQIPADVVMTLFRTETLTGRDFIGERTYVLADGSKLPSAQFILRELRVGGHRLTNVTASVGNAAGELLLGQSFLSRFKTVTFDYERRVVILTER